MLMGILTDPGDPSLSATLNVQTTTCLKMLWPMLILPIVFDYMSLGRKHQFSVVRCYLNCPYYDDLAEAIGAMTKFATALIRYILGTRMPEDTYCCPGTSNVPVTISSGTRSLHCKWRWGLIILSPEITSQPLLQRVCALWIHVVRIKCFTTFHFPKLTAIQGNYRWIHSFAGVLPPPFVVVRAKVLAWLHEVARNEVS